MKSFPNPNKKFFSIKKNQYRKFYKDSTELEYGLGKEIVYKII